MSKEEKTDLENALDDDLNKAHIVHSQAMINFEIVQFQLNEAKKKLNEALQRKQRNGKQVGTA